MTRAAREPLGPGVAERILSLAEGNPLALCELPRALSASERAGEAALPPTLHPGEALTRAYRRRLEALAPQSRRAVLLAFVSEDGALGRILAALGSAGAGSAALERAEAAGVLTLEQGRATPRHPLLRPIALDLFGPAARRAAHRALAECLEPERHGEQRAWHLAEAAVGPDERAAAALDHAAIAAAARTGYAAAARVIERAASLSEDEPNAWRRRAVAAQAALAAGRAAWASAILEPGPGARVPGPLEPEIAHLRGRLGFLTGHLDTAFELLTRDAERIAADDPARTSLMLADATLARSLSGDCYAALRTAERAYALGRAAGAAAPTVIGCLVLALALRGEARRARSLIDRFDELNSEIEPLSPAGQMAVVTTGSEAWLGDLDLATARVERWIARALEDGAVGFIAHPLWVACEIDFRAGRWARARARGEEAVALLVETGQTSTLGVALASLAIVEAGLGMPEAAVAHASEAGGSQSATASAAWASSRPRAAAFCTSA